jgi:hypothetical protein
VGFGSVESYDASQPGGNVLDPVLRADLMFRARAGLIHCLVGGPPCRSFSPANAAGVVKRTRTELWPHIPSLPAEWLAYVLHDNACFEFMAELALAVYESGGEFIIENPADLGDPESPVYRPACAEAPSGFITPPMLALREEVPCVMVVFPQCGLRALWRKLTGLLCSPRVGARRMWLQRDLLVPPRGCACVRHAARAFGRDAAGNSRSAASARWNERMCAALVEALATEAAPPPASAPGEVGAPGTRPSGGVWSMARACTSACPRRARSSAPGRRASSICAASPRLTGLSSRRRPCR